jgi:hypothetical protein
VLSSLDNNLDARNVNTLTLSRSTFDTTTGAATANIEERHNFYGFNVRNLTVQNGTIFDGGTTFTDNVHNVKIDNLLGTSVFDNSIIRDGRDMNLLVTNAAATSYAGAADTLVLRNNTRLQSPSPGSAAPGDNAQIRATTDGNLSFTIQGGVSGNSQFTGGQNCVQLVAEGLGNFGKLTSSITQATMTGNNGPCINLATANIGALTATVQGLTLSSALSTPVNISNQGASTLKATITGNTINIASGLAGNGITAEVENNGTLTADLSSNVISGGGTYGIRGQAKTNGSVLNLRISQNTVTLTNSQALEGIAIEAGSSAGASSALVCLNMFSNNSTSAGVGPEQGFRTSVRASTTFRLQDFVGNGSVAADIATWINSTKSNTGTVQTFFSGGGVYSAAPQACPVP